MMENEHMKKVRVMIVDDSLVSRKLYQSILASHPDFEICGFASNGKEAVEMVADLNPNVISMDIEMPLMNGLEATRLIMYENPLPILIVSSLYRKEEIQLGMQVLEAGAVGIIAKPYGPGHPSYEKDAKNYVKMIRAMAEVKVVRRRLFTSSMKAQVPLEKPKPVNTNNNIELVVVGASAGGPEAVKALLEGFDDSFPVPVLVVQHIDPHFADGYSQWLGGHTKMQVKIASENEFMMPGTVYLSAGGKHLAVLGKNRVGSFEGSSVNGHKPSVEFLFDTARKHYNNNLVAVLLSGMGTDGAMAMKRLYDIGAVCIAQDAASCLVFGMPGEAIKIGATTKVLSPTEISKEILIMLNKNRNL